MKNLLRIEELLFFGLALALFIPLEYPGWLYAVFFLAPDLGMLGYLWDPRVGAWTYNLLHHKGIAITLYILGTMMKLPQLQFAGLVVLGHSSVDRVFGYCLKFTDSFQNTHLGSIGRLN